MKQPVPKDGDDDKKIESTDVDTSDDGDSSDDVYTLQKRSRGKRNTRRWKWPRKATVGTTKKKVNRHLEILKLVMIQPRRLLISVTILHYYLTTITT